MKRVIPLIAGILFSISIVQAQTPTGITLIDDAGRPGDTVRVFGHFFQASPGAHTVTFNGSMATIIDLNDKFMKVEVPDIAPGPAAVVIETASYKSSDYLNFQILRNDSGEVQFEQISDVVPGGTNIGQIAFGDLNNDGLLDLIGTGTVSGNGALFWQQNNGDGNFAPPILIESTAYKFILIDDFDNDGRVDIAASLNGGSSIFFNEGGSHTKVPAPLFTFSEIISFDINYDGIKDFINGDNWGAYIVINNGDRTFQSPYLIFPQEFEGETYAYGVDVADINNDLYADVLVGSQRRGWSRAYLNDPLAPGQFTERININPGNLAHTDLLGVDINNDGWNDVVSATENTFGFIYNINNQDNSFESYYYIEQFLATNEIPKRLEAKDFSNDGNVDIIGTVRDKIFWTENTGGDFETRQVFSVQEPTYNRPKINVGDIDNDGDYDVSISNSILINRQNNNEILDFQITGQLGDTQIDSVNQKVLVSVEAAIDVSSLTPNFTLSADASAEIDGVLQTSGVDQVDFTLPVQYTIISEYGVTENWEVSVESRIDLNFIEPAEATAGSIIKLYGSGFDLIRSNNTVTFNGQAASIIQDDTPSTNHLIVVVPNTNAGPTKVVVSNSTGSSYDRTNFIIIDNSQENGVSWNLRHEIQTSQVTLSSINTADLDGNGFVDIITTSSGDGLVMVRLNMGDGTFSTPFQVGEVIEGMKETHIADLDRDGDLDIITSSLGGAGWVKNFGDGQFGPYIEISATELPILNLSDVDGDGSIDIISSAFSIKWYLNDGLGTFTEQTTDEILLSEGFTRTFPGDVNNDGLFDLIVHSFNGPGAKLFLNTGSNFVFEKQLNSFTYNKIIPDVIDLDGDGLEDLVTWADSQGNMIWNKNLGNNNFGISNNIYLPYGFPKQYDFGDIDGDGDVDFSYAVNDDISFHKFENGSFNSNRFDLINVFPLGDNSVKLADIDSDGDLDVLAADAVSDILYMIENQNTQNELLSFDISEQISSIVPDPNSLELVIGVPSNTDLTSITPSFETSFKAKAFIDNEELVSGITTLDFSTDKWMKVVSESGDTINWSVRILPIPEESLSQLMLFIDQTTAIYTWSSAEFADSYEIEVSTVPTFASTIPGYGPATANGGENSKLILGLSAGTQYYLRIRSVNQAGVSSYSNTTQLLTLPATPQVRIDSIYQEGVDISWLSQSNVGLFRLDVSEDGFQTFIQGYSGKMINGSEVSTSIMGLEPGVEYFIRMSAQNQTGESPTSQFRQLTTVPQTPVAEEAESITPVSFEASWQSVTNGVTGYVLQVYNINGEVVFQGSYLSSQPVEITGLSSGDTYAYIVFSYNAFGFSPPSDPVEVTTIIPDPISIDVTETELFPVSSPFIEIDVDITGGWGERFVVLRYRGLSGKTFEPEIVLNSTGTDQYSAIISPSMLDDMGIYYDIATLDELGNGKISNGYTMRWSFDDELDFTIPFDNFGGSKNNWQMFSVPYELEDDLIESVFDEIGNVDYKKAWRLMSYRNQGGNGEYIDFGEGINRIEPGKGYWFNSIDRVEIKLDGGQITEEIPFVMELEPGWNQIGNPYPVPINWTTVVTQNAASGSQVGNLQVFDGSVQFQTTILYPFQGAFVWSDTGSPITIDPATAKANGKTDKYVARIENSNIDNGTWQVDLSLSTPDGKKRLGGFGMHPMASELKDDFDEMTVPRFFSYTSLSTYKPEFIYPWFTTDIVLEKEASNWDFTFESNSGDSQYDITWDNAEFAQSSAALYLLNLSSGKLINMKEETRVQVTPKNSFRILFNKNPEGIDFGNKWVIGTVYPNPAESRVTIPLIIPESSDVEVSIMDLQGKTVKVLRSGRLNEGHHELNWNLDSYSGQKVGSGVYILMLKYGEMQQTMYKRLIVK